MNCSNCGKEFDGKFCPDCGAMAEEVQQSLTRCPNCGAERMGNSRFCANCGYNFEDPTQSISTDGGNKPGKNLIFGKVLSLIAKIYRWLLAGGMLFVGLISLLCLTAPTLVESFLGESNPLCTGFMAIGGGSGVDVSDSVVGASKTLLVVSLLALVYGGLQMFWAIKKPYINMVGKKKFIFCAIDGVIVLLLFILGCVVAGAAGSDEFMDCSVGSGFAMCIVMGIFGLLFLGSRIFYELKLFKWEDSGLSQEQIERTKEKKERKKLTRKQIMAIILPIVAVVVIIAVVVPSVSFANNIFRVGKVDKINIGDSQEQVIKVLGEPYDKSDYCYEYYSDDYVKVLEQIEKLSGNSRSLTANMSIDDWDFDLDDDIDLDEDIDIGGSDSKLDKLYAQLKKMTYKYIRVDFDSDKKVNEIYFDNNKNNNLNSEESKKEVENYILKGNTILQQYEVLNLTYSVSYKDGSLYKGIVINRVYTEIESNTVEWTDIFKNKFNAEIKVTPITTLTSEIVKTIAGGDKSTLTEFEIASNITSIESNAFDGCVNLISLEIPKSITWIGSSAFRGCSKLTIYCNVDTQPSNWANNWNTNRPVYWGSKGGFVAEDGITYVISNEVGNVLRITSAPKDISGKLVIPSEITYKGQVYTVAEIVSSVFEGCSGITSIELPSYMTKIGFNAFKGCDNITTATIPTTAIEYVPKIKLEKVVINGGEEIISYAFKGCSSLTSVTIPNSVTNIGSYAFYDCTGLTSIEIPSSVTSIGYAALWECSSLTSIEIPSGVTSIGSEAFYGCSSLTSIEIPSSVTSIGASAFSGCSNLAIIYCEVTGKPSGWASTWVYNNGSDVSVVWGHNNVTTNAIYDYVIHNDKVYLTKYKGGGTDVVIPNTIGGKEVVSIGNAFDRNESIISIEIPSSVMSIGDYAFYNCIGLTSIEIPSSVTSFGSSAFYYCSSLTSIEIPSSVTSIGDYAFRACNRLTSIEIPSSIASLGYEVFRGCGNLMIYCEAESEPSGWNSNWDSMANVYSDRCLVVWNCKYNDVASDGNIYYTADSGIRYALKDGEAVVARQPWTLHGTITIPAVVTYKGSTYNVMSIGRHAFNDCDTMLSNIVIPSSVTSIPSQTFRYCWSSIIYCEASSQPSGWANDWNYSDLPVVWNCKYNDVASDGNIYYTADSGIRYALKDGEAVVARQPWTLHGTITIPAVVTYKGSTYNVTSIIYYAFHSCSSLTSIVIPSSVTSIGYNIFGENRSITIYCEVESKPSGWDSSWNYSNCPVIWGYKN